MAMDKKLNNIILLGFSLMLVKTASITMVNIMKILFYSIHTDNPDFTVDAYTALAFSGVTLILFTWLSPPIISVTGPKAAMIYGAITYTIVVLQFLWPQNWLVYFCFFLDGTGLAMMWTAKGTYLTLNSTAATISRNAGICWSIMQLSMFGGNLFIYLHFRGLTHIDKKNRTITLSVLAGIATLAIISFTLLPRVTIDTSSMTEKEIKEHSSPFEVFKAAVRLIFTKNMLFLSFVFLFAGAETSFYTGVYGSCIGFTNQFGERARQLVGLSGIFVGAGEITGGILAAKFTRWGRAPVVIGGFVVYLVACLLTFLNLPNGCPISVTDEDAFIDSSALLAILCAFLLGLADACYCTQIVSIVGGLYRHNSASGFAVFRLYQSVALTIYFSIVSSMGLYTQLGILLILSILGTSTFVHVEYTQRKKASTAQENGTELEVGFDAENV